jgi:hypothetical protein
MQQLLLAGADANSTPSFADGARLQSPLAEYLRTQSVPSVECVRQLLQYGARVVMRSPVLDPLGILRYVAKVYRCVPRNREYSTGRPLAAQMWKCLNCLSTTANAGTHQRFGDASSWAMCAKRSWSAPPNQ